MTRLICFWLAYLRIFYEANYSLPPEQQTWSDFLSELREGKEGSRYHIRAAFDCQVLLIQVAGWLLPADPPEPAISSTGAGCSPARQDHGAGWWPGHTTYQPPPRRPVGIISSLGTVDEYFCLLMQALFFPKCVCTCVIYGAVTERASHRLQNNICCVAHYAQKYSVYPKIK